MPNEEKSALEKLEEKLLSMWKKSGHASLIAGRHSEFVVEPKVFMGEKLHPEIMKTLLLSYLATTSKQDSGTGKNVEVAGDKLVIRDQNGKKAIIVRDKNIISQFLATRS